MRKSVRLAAAVAIALAACGGGEQGPRATQETGSPPPPASPVSCPAGAASPSPLLVGGGEARVDVNGDVNESFTASLDPDAENTLTPCSGESELTWVNEQGRRLTTTLTIEDGELTDAFVAIGLPGSSLFDKEYYPDALHTQCTVTVSKLDQAGVAGAIECEGLERADGQRSIDATATFSAAAST